MPTVALRRLDALYDALDLGERIGRFAFANALHVDGERVVLTFDRRTAADALANTRLALLIDLGENWAATVRA